MELKVGGEGGGGQPKSEIKLRGKGIQKCEYTMDEYNPKQK